MYDYIIVGNGIAGLSAATEIRAKDKSGKILIISKENYPTYWRTRLSDLISKDFEKESTLVKKEKWYEDNNIEEKLDCEVLKIDKENKKVILENNEELSYSKLLLATGASPFIPPIENADKEGVFAIRSLDSLIDFKSYIKEKRNAVIIGGGLLGLEAAYSLVKAGLKVSVIEGSSYILKRQLDEETSLRLKEKLNDLSIEILTNKSTKRILTKDNKVSGLEFEDGTKIDADVIMIQAGVRANLQVAKNSGLEVDRGILANEHLITKDESIFVAGDCAQVGQSNIGLWTNSTDMGKIAGNNMTGGNESYSSPKPFSSLLLGDIKLFSAGSGFSDDLEKLKVDKDDKTYILFKKDNKFVSSILWQDLKYQNDCKQIVFENKNPKETKLGKEIFGL